MGEALGHTWADATCSAPKTCTVCGVTEGEALGHDWEDADCDTPKTCKVCGLTEGEALGHDWADATCSAPKTCKVCGATDGKALEHVWKDATCDAPKTCKACNATEGEKLSHHYGDWEILTPPTEEAPGEKKKVCTLCGNEITEEIPKIVFTTLPLNEKTEGIKILGERHAKNASYITMDWSCSGIELNINLYNTSSVFFLANAASSCYFKAYVDGVAYKNGTSEYFTVTTQGTTIELKDLSSGEHTIRLIKVTGYTIATAQVSSITLNGTIDPVAPAKNDLYIEFLGDSISCGWGVIGNHDGGYASQDGTKAYPYRVAERLNADYSITALSGRGVIYGSDLNFDKNYLHASPSRSQEEYSFARQADIVVINLGTNDRGLHANVNDFEDAYVRLLDNIFKKNGEDCVVYCLWGVMNDAYNTYIQAAIARYQEDHPNAQIHILPLPQATFTEAGGHPSEGDNTRYMLMLEAKIKSTYPGFAN